MGLSQNWTTFRGHFKHFRGFSEDQGTEWSIFLGLLKFQILLKQLFDVLKILDIICGEP